MGLIGGGFLWLEGPGGALFDTVSVFGVIAWGFCMSTPPLQSRHPWNVSSAGMAKAIAQEVAPGLH